ncbi:hypothetical protein NQ314_017270 [Rhamnusium bicolor]|uniref:Regulatory protein zeste n=1 Tax=Rhamnusium bicolor TaxID=1586634 RepID=A0AAV8WUZ6_9CUCU|nr:hypothetical protein NQ314_017270 [Rhamnusium bicolor]
MASKIVVYTVKEKILLANLIDKHKLVENKKTDAATVQMKQHEWEKIASEYNSQGDITMQRTSAQLKKLWNNLKQSTEEKYTRLVTGGGPPLEIKTDPVMEVVDAAAPNADVTITCPWDSTAVYMRENDIEDEYSGNEKIEVVFEEDNNYCNEDDGQPTAEISGVSNSFIEAKQKVSAYTTPKAKNIKTILQSEGNLRLRKLRESIEQQAVLHNVRLRIEEELHRKVASERRKAEAEEELALLKLKKFKKENL